AFTAIAASVTPGVVRVEAERMPDRPRRIFSQRLRGFMDPDTSAEQAPEVAGGSGFIVSADGYIVTNNHVVEGADFISVRLFDKRSLPARLVGRDPFTDVALLKIEATNLPALQFGDSDDANVGEWVLAIGNPGFGDTNTLDFTVTSGIISAKGRPLDVLDPMSGNDTLDRFAIEDFIQTDATINPGNSGGPLLNLDGDVVGVNTAIASTTGYNQGYAFAIPSNLVQRVIKDLAAHGHVRRPLLGVQIQDVTQEDAEVFKLPEISGVLVEDFSENSPAETSGLERGDVIVALEGKKIERVGQLQRLIADHAPGQVVDLRVVRYGALRNFKIKLTQAPLPVNDAEPRRPRTPVGAGRLGIQVVELTEELADKHRFDRAGGAVITAVQAGSAAGRKRFRPPLRILEINRRRIDSALQAQALLRTLQSGNIVSLLLQDPTGVTTIVNIRVP
ncbi:MAG: trypsin-like peptidase domain-containing protein, partial [Longimicrobiales bacterium]